LPPVGALIFESRVDPSLAAGDPVKLASRQEMAAR
jgi:hypothetical protein